MGTVNLLEWTMKDPLNCIGYCAGVCWDSNTSVTNKNIKRALQCIEDGHGRVEELPDIYVVLEGYSAKCIRELYTHIGGSPTRVQASTRYIDYSSDKNFKVVKPKTVAENKEANLIWDSTIAHIRESIQNLNKLNIPIEDSSGLLPLDYESKMIWKVNLRCLINFFEQRMCGRAYWEIRQLCYDLKAALRNYSEEWNTLTKLFVPKCKRLGYCPESRSCGAYKSEVNILY